METVNTTLLLKFLNGNCSLEEQEFVRVWINKNPENQMEFVELEKTMAWNNALIKEKGINTNQAWNAIENKIEESEFKLRPRTWIRIAASVAAFVFITFFLVQQLEKPSGYTTIEANLERLQINLPDGSKVWLKPNTKIQYAQDFEKNRVIKLEGEAFFDVVKNKAFPFVIKTQDAQVKVLGTSFLVRNFDQDSLVQVYVETGKVAFSKSEKEQLALEPKMLGKLHKKTGDLQQAMESNSNLLAWKTGVLQFENTPLNQLLLQLIDTFGTTISIDEPRLETCRYNGKFINKNLNQILEILQFSFGFEMENQGGEIILKNGTCSN